MTDIQAKVPPHDLEAERLVLGGILIDNSILPSVGETLTDKSFYLSQHRLIYSAMSELYDRDLPVDLITLKDELLRRGILEKVGGMAYMASLAAGVSAVTNVKHYANIVADKSLLRSLIGVCSGVVEQCYEGQKQVGEIVDLAQQAVYDVTQFGSKSPMVPVREIVKDNLDVLEKLATGEKKCTGVPTGFAELDRLILGLHPGELIIVGSRPSVGKTSLCLNIAYNAAGKEEVPVLVFTIEMSKEEIINRMLASQAGVWLSKIRSGSLSKKDREVLNEAGDELSKRMIFIDDSASLTPLEMRSRAKQAKVERNVGIVMVDYLQLMHYHKWTENRQQEVTAISRALKSMARELDVAVVAFSQLSRDVTRRREGKVPQLSDLRESGSLEQDADVVIFLHDPSLYSPRKKGERYSRPDAVEIDVIVAKQRNGPTDTVRLLFQTKYACFKNISAETPPPWVAQDDDDVYLPDSSDES